MTGCSLNTDADPKAKPGRHWSPPPDDDVIDRPVNTNDYEVSVKQQKSVKLTQSVVEVHQPRDLAAPDHEEVPNAQHIATWCCRSNSGQREGSSQVLKGMLKLRTHLNNSYKLLVLH